mmetsp:Transcript_1446/g.2415  ORF Transcript_1446/g.2415 Transcript_1446/m.2415 type:complete len:529 (+) Transcript_1446:88-1674(+)
MAALQGIQFPVDPKTNDRSTLVAGVNALAASVSKVDPALAAELKAMDPKKFRFKYNSYYVKMVELSCASKKNALQIAHDGLDYLENNFQFYADGKAMTLKQAMTSIKGSFDTAIVQGKKKEPASRLSVPYENGSLTGPALRGQLDKWARAGTIEPSAAEAIKQVAENEGWLDLRDKYFVLLGAGSAMGPLPLLLACGANIIAVDLNRPAIWERIIKLASNSPGKLYIPVKSGSNPKTDEEICAVAGCNLFTDTPQILNWLVTVEPGKQLVVGSYAYLDGAKHVQVSLAMDAIIGGLIEKRKDIIVASLCTPTDCHVISKEAYGASLNQYNKVGVFEKLMNAASGGKYCIKNARRPIKGEAGEDMYICDSIARPQGPNYTLAKRIQIWRAMIAREEDGCGVSINVAPATATQSVVHEKTFAWVYSGLPYFKPVEIFQQDTSNAVMGALLIHDVQNKNSVAYPQKVPLKHPLDLITSGAFHGGMWRMSCKMDSIGEAAVLLHWFTVLKPAVVLFLILFMVGVYLFGAKYL